MTFPKFARLIAGPALLLGAIMAAPAAHAVGVGQTCGGIAGVSCDSGLWCEPPAGRCGGADLQGTCVRIPQVCTEQYAPVCGCNGKTYGNDCQRRAASIGKKADGACQ